MGARPDMVSGPAGGRRPRPETDPGGATLGITRTLAAFASEASAIPDGIVAETKRLVLDTLGAARRAAKRDRPPRVDDFERLQGLEPLIGLLGSSVAPSRAVPNPEGEGVPHA